MSVSSFEGSPVPLDLEAKYQKVVSEYAKIRAQFGVLKKAVVDEQNHSSELKETLRVKDQNLRKAEQEIDSLTFRNQQLTKRVSILQDELDTAQNAGKKGKSKGPSRDIPNSILAEELQKKISENAQLVSTLQEENEKHEAEKFKLIQNKELFEHELEECKKKLANIEEIKLTKLETDNKQLHAKLNAKEEILQKLNTEIKLLRNKANERGMEPVSDDWKEKFAKLLQLLGFEDLLRMMITFFRNFELLYKRYIDDGLSGKFSKCIESNIAALSSFINSYSNYCVNILSSEDFLSGFEHINKSVNSYVIGLDELATYLTCGKDEEISQMFKDMINSLKNHWVQFNSALKMCLALNKTSSDAEECAAAFADVFRSLKSTCDYFSSSFTDDEFRGPGADDSGKEMLSTLSKISVHSSSIYKKLTENRILIRNAIEYRPVKQRCNLVDLEDGQCCQQWKEKFEAMNAAHSKKIKDLEEQISCLSGAGTPRSSHSGNTAHSPVEGKDKIVEITNMLGVLTGPSSLTGSKESHEAELTKYFNARANTLIADRQLAESKVTALKSECEALQKRLEHSMECREMLEASIKQTQDTVARLQEELATTTSNYELQLSSLSEHMANMNDKLASQQEEIEVLNYQLTEKGAKKGKSK